MSFVSTASDNNQNKVHFDSKFRENEDTENPHVDIFINGGKDYSMFLIPELPSVGPLKKSLRIIVYREDESIFIESPELHITESGESISEAFDEFCSFFIHDYRSITKMEDKMLDSNARELKKAYLEYL
jgi:hypothetical protein